MSRGVDGMNIFRDDLDRKLFVELLEETVVRHGWLLHDWVMMSNHYHLVVYIDQQRAKLREIAGRELSLTLPTLGSTLQQLRQLRAAG